MTAEHAQHTTADPRPAPMLPGGSGHLREHDPPYADLPEMARKTWQARWQPKSQSKVQASAADALIVRHLIALHAAEADNRTGCDAAYGLDRLRPACNRECHAAIDATGSYNRAPTRLI